MKLTYLGLLTQLIVRCRTALASLPGRECHSTVQYRLIIEEVTASTLHD